MSLKEHKAVPIASTLMGYQFYALLTWLPLPLPIHKFFFSPLFTFKGNIFSLSWESYQWVLDVDWRLGYQRLTHSKCCDTLSNVAYLYDLSELVVYTSVMKSTVGGKNNRGTLWPGCISDYWEYKMQESLWSEEYGPWWSKMWRTHNTKPSSTLFLEIFILHDSDIL